MKNENEISVWQEAISSLPDKEFFYIMRLYLGEIKTPYNKQRLVSQLASFIRSKENLENILTLLNDFDIKILTAINTINTPTQQILFDFFEGEFSQEDIFSKLLNLSERLLIYKKTNSINFDECFSINPLLYDNLLPFLNKKLLFPDCKIDFFSTSDIFSLSPNFLAAYFSYIKNKGLSCKADGSLKKNDVTRLCEIFPLKQNVMQLVSNAFINLSILKEGQKSFEINEQRLEAFAELSQINQYSLICAASVSRFSSEGLRKESQLLIDCFSSIPETGFSRQSILRLAFLTGTSSQNGFKSFGGKDGASGGGRFSRILQAARQDSSIDTAQNSKLLERMVDSAIELGLLQNIGKTQKGEDVFAANQIFKMNQSEVSAAFTSEKILSIDSTFTVTFLPGLSLKKLLSVTNLMMVKKYAVVTEFEITRQSISLAFDKGLSPEKIFELLSQYSNYDIPQNLKINILEWFKAYESAILYQGYVLKVSDSNITLVENNPKIKNFIQQKLAPGIYFLQIPQNSDIKDFIQQSGLDFLGKTKTSTVFSEFTTFPLLRPAKKIILKNEDFSFNSKNDIAEPKLNDSQNLDETQITQNRNEIQETLLKTLETMELEEYQKEGLKHRIEHQLILSENHLRNTGIRTEIFEAKGTDYAGKVHLIESSIKDGDLMEFEYPNQNKTPENKERFHTFLGHPNAISKSEGEAVMRFIAEPSKEVLTFLVSKIITIKRIRY